MFNTKKIAEAFEVENDIKADLDKMCECSADEDIGYLYEKMEKKAIKAGANVVWADWKDTQELVEFFIDQIRSLGGYVVENPACEGSDGYGYFVFTTKPDFRINKK